MWLLIVASCLAADPGPDCGAGVSPIHYTSFGDCEAAAVRYHDHMRAFAEEDGQTVLLLETRCLPIPSGPSA